MHVSLITDIDNFARNIANKIGSLNIGELLEKIPTPANAIHSTIQKIEEASGGEDSIVGTILNKFEEVSNALKTVNPATILDNFLKQNTSNVEITADSEKLRNSVQDSLDQGKYTVEIEEEIVPSRNSPLNMFTHAARAEGGEISSNTTALVNEVG